MAKTLSLEYVSNLNWKKVKPKNLRPKRITKTVSIRGSQKRGQMSKSYSEEEQLKIMEKFNKAEKCWSESKKMEKISERMEANLHIETNSSKIESVMNESPIIRRSSRRKLEIISNENI